ncbi:FAD-dependent oxidoreductase [Arachidicoccus ginsenosidivorans]|uniref:FAD-binding oxidoreductase n=1 Tax=Arachidicoccus ginsenosidivorans TaxID=496057 RepID=A0A5B8VNC5_9BACT|nr:FAD-dependent oxidoreductase [Arachidicoccus ginsenosidivorans]QEC72601.1 FAD-binding oxidoreductase [Arachidicoccus ginsenosidivorans]
MKAVDVIIVGQGIAGTLLSFELMEAGLSVMVVDATGLAGASRVASGVINPVTGRRVVETWKIAALLPLATSCYQRISSLLGIATVAKPLDILAVHGSIQMQEAFNKRLQQGSTYLKSVPNEEDYHTFFKMRDGLHGISPAILIDLQNLFTAYRAYLIENNKLISAHFDWNALQLPDSSQSSFVYQKEGISLSSKWVIAAEGITSGQNPYFEQVAFRYNKGEALIISVPGLPREQIYKLRYSLVPWGDNQTDENLFWVGSSYQWDYKDDQPSVNFKEAVTAFLDAELLLPYQITDHLAAIRPASVNRRPFAGVHKDYPRLGLLNGLGTKGCSLAPYLARAWRDYIMEGKPFDLEVALETTRH